ncbi:trigger factor, partial [Chryseobacterium sp.]
GFRKGKASRAMIEKYYSETSPDDYEIEHYENIFFQN